MNDILDTLNIEQYDEQELFKSMSIFIDYTLLYNNQAHQVCSRVGDFILQNDSIQFGMKGIIHTSSAFSKLRFSQMNRLDPKVFSILAESLVNDPEYHEFLNFNLNDRNIFGDINNDLNEASKQGSLSLKFEKERLYCAYSKMLFSGLYQSYNINQDENIHKAFSMHKESLNKFLNNYESKKDITFYTNLASSMF